MVNTCNHLNQKEKEHFLSLFKQYSHVFNGGIDTVPGPPVHLKLKPGAVPYYARSYMTPRAFEAIPKNEVQELHDIDILSGDIATAYGFPIFFCAKKDGGVRVVTDVHKLNEMLD